MIWTNFAIFTIICLLWSLFASTFSKMGLNPILYGAIGGFVIMGGMFLVGLPLFQ